MIVLTDKEARFMLETLQALNAGIAGEFDGPDETAEECIRILEDSVELSNKNTFKVPRSVTVWRTPVPDPTDRKLSFLKNTDWEQEVCFTYFDKERGYKHVIINDQIFKFVFV